jgi:hypothetical protein
VETPTDMRPADEHYAARVASMVLASFMQQPPDTKTMVRQLTTLCIGVPRATLTRLVDPRVGVASETEFFSLAAVKKWIDGHAPKPVLPEHRLLPPVKEEQVPPEERERRIGMLKGTAEQIRQIARSNVVGRPSEADPKGDARLRSMQVSSGEKLLETDLMQRKIVEAIETEKQ